MDGHLTRETIDLITALRPFADRRGQSLIDTIMDLTEGIGDMEGMQIGSLAEKARNQLTSKVDSAVSLFLIILASAVADLFSGQNQEVPADPILHQ